MMKKEIGLLRDARNDGGAVAVELITKQWSVIQEKVEDTKREALKMGMLLAKVEQELSGPKAGRGALGLKGWIETNLPPHINSAYQTLMRWKQAALAYISQVGCGADYHYGAAILGYQMNEQDIVVPSKAYQRKSDEILADKSLNQLVFDFREEKKAPGRKPGMNPDSYKDMKKTPEENALYAWSKVLAPITNQTEPMAAILPVDYAREALAALTPLVAALTRRIKEG